MENKNPYVGPRSFELNEKMYGRDRERRQLTDRLISERIVLLHSPSGAGKTSLVRAGLIPQLEEEGFFVHPIIRVNLERSADLVKITDTLKDVNNFNRYTFSTLLSLEEQYPDEAHLDAERLARMSIDDYLHFRARDEKREGPEFLIFDQFEEVLTIDPTDRAAKNAFFTQLGTAFKNRDRWALFAMRTDFVAALEPYVRSVPTYFSNTFHLELLGVKSALEAIQKPAQNAGILFTDAAAARLVDDLRRIQVQQLDGSTETQLGLYVEPVQLQVVCYRLWESKAADDNDIDENDLASVGDVNQSLAEYYAISLTKVAQSTGVAERTIREWFDRKLITNEGIRSQVRMGAEMSDGLENNAVRQLENTHLIRAEKRAGQTWYELAHDRLIEPVLSDNQRWFTANLSLFQRQAVLWSEQGRGEGLLLRGAELDTAEQQAQTMSLTPEETEFLEACRTLRAREQRDRLQRRLILVGAIVSFVFFVAALFFGINAANANAALQSAKDAADQAAYNAQVASTQAIEAQAVAQIASTKAYESADQAATSQAEAVKERDNAQKQAAIAQTQEAKAYEAATQVAIEKANAEAAKAEADAQAQVAKSSELVAKSILANNQNNVKAATLLAIEAFLLSDNPGTRNQLLNFIFGSLALYQSPQAGLITNTAFNGDDSTLLTANVYCKEDTLFICTDSSLKFWSASRAGNIINRLSQGETRKQGSLDSMAVNPAGTTVATAFCDFSDNTYKCDKEDLILWDIKTQARTGQQISITKDAANQGISNNALVLMAYSPDGKILALGLNKNTILLLDAESLTEIARIPENYESFQMVFSQDSKSLIFANNGKLVLLDVATKQKTELPAGVGPRSVLSVAASPDGKYFASGDKNGFITLWDAITLKKLNQNLKYDIAKVVSLAFSPDSKILAAGYDDKGLILWDMEAKQRLTRPLYNHTSNTIYDLAFTHDGKILASVASEIILWTVDSQQWLRLACKSATRNFTKDEWQQYFPGQEYRLTCSQYGAGN